MWAIIPINTFSKSLSRLSPILDLDERIELAKNLSTRLIHILVPMKGIEKVIVFTSETNWSKKIKHSKLIIHEDKGQQSFKRKIDSVADMACGMGAKKLI